MCWAGYTSFSSGGTWGVAPFSVCSLLPELTFQELRFILDVQGLKEMTPARSLWAVWSWRAGDGVRIHPSMRYLYHPERIPAVSGWETGSPGQVISHYRTHTHTLLRVVQSDPSCTWTRCKPLFEWFQYLTLCMDRKHPSERFSPSVSFFIPPHHTESLSHRSAMWIWTRSCCKQDASSLESHLFVIDAV